MFARLNRLTRSDAARPCPLEVIAAQPARDIHSLTDAKQPRHFLGFHCLLRQAVGADPAKRDLRLGIALTAIGDEWPTIEQRACLCQLDVALVGKVPV